VPLERLSPYLSAHMKNIQNGGRMESVHQFEYEVLLDSELDLLEAPFVLHGPLLDS
jgi:hypothetical protein